MKKRISKADREEIARLKAEAAACRKRSRESFERCDTDGFLSQWASDINANLYEEKARIIEQRGMSTFVGLYQGNRRVKARLVEGAEFYGRRSWSWLLADEEEQRFGRKFIPSGKRSRIQKQLGLREASEMAPADAKIHSSGRGLSGCASARVIHYRIGDRFGADAILIEEE